MTDSYKIVPEIDQSESFDMLRLMDDDDLQAEDNVQREKSATVIRLNQSELGMIPQKTAKSNNNNIDVSIDFESQVQKHGSYK